MSVERMKFADLDGDSTGNMSSDKRNGCHVSTATGFVLVLLSIAIAVGVALIVFFAVRDNRTTGNNGCSPLSANNGGEPVSSDSNKFPISHLDRLWKDCLSLSKVKNECLSAPHCPGMPSGVDNATGTGSGKPSLPRDVRLPTALTPTLYEVELRPDIYRENPEDFVFDGTVVISLQVVTSTSMIVLHINKLTIDNSSIRVEDAGGVSQSWTHWEEDKARQFFKLHLSQPLQQGALYRLTLGFSGVLADDLAGIYRSTYTQQGVTKHIMTSQMQPTDARKSFPCMDEPAIKSQFKITLLRKPPMIALSNMPVESSQSRAGGWIADTFQTSVKMPTYLIGLIVCDFSYKEATTNRGTTFRVYARPEAIDTADYALDIGVRMLEFFEGYFNIPYPLPKQDMIAIPDFAAGAMENWGLITYRETALLYDPLVSSASNKQRVAYVVSHELSHQWFGNLVSPEWWDDLWLNEGFATYMEYLGVQEVEPGFRMLDQFVIGDFQSVLRSDGLATSHPLFVPVDHPDEINEIFDSISYAKGGSIVRMMNSFLGESTFTTGLTNYLNNHSYGNARHTDLWNFLGAQAVRDGMTAVNVTLAMNTWVTQMGYPLVTFQRNPSSPERARLSQKHYLTDPTATPSAKYPSPHGYKWVIPVTFTTNVNPDWNNPEVHWMNMADLELASVTASADWVVANVGVYGYYRVNYDLRNWDQLINQLINNHQVIPARNRAQLIDDAFNLGKSGELPVVYGLRTTQYLNAERDYLPWRSTTVNLGYFGTMLRKTATYGLYKKYMLNLITPSYNRLGWNIQASDPHLDKYLRTSILSWACSLGHQPCLDEASNRFQQWMDNPSNNPIAPDLKSLVYCYAVQNGNEAEWDFAFQQYNQANVATEKSKLLYALACTKVPWLLHRFISKTTNASEIRKQDASSAIGYVARSAIGGYIAWDFFQGQWDFIKKTWGSGFFAINNMVRSIAGHFNTPLELQQLEDFMEKHPDLGSSNRTFHQVLESVKTNIRWMKDNQQDIHAWLQTVTA